ncbi:hypothetical protein O4159_13290 [Gordonia terrae]|nr:hypothetical protein [Gordonia terrae]
MPTGEPSGPADVMTTTPEPKCASTSRNRSRTDAWSSAYTDATPSAM